MNAENYFVYVISSEVANKFYVGMSADPQARLKQHNAGHSQFTKGFRPWKLAYSEFAGSRENARKLEKYYKTGAGRKHWQKILEGQKLSFGN
jgi:putative endonuclease